MVFSCLPCSPFVLFGCCCIVVLFRWLAQRTVSHNNIAKPLLGRCPATNTNVTRAPTPLHSNKMVNKTADSLAGSPYTRIEKNKGTERVTNRQRHTHTQRHTDLATRIITHSCGSFTLENLSRHLNQHQARIPG
ncbi:hypothetical protein DFH27DRAFT_185928 [Peziza echinospora]|nr:hypothetical protein DFH27DRAFT_185928 [Peziza echinospora]